MACRNPELAEYRAAKREALLAAIEQGLAKIATRRNAEGCSVSSLRGLLDKLQAVRRTPMRVMRGDTETPVVTKTTEPDEVQREALQLAGINGGKSEWRIGLAISSIRCFFIKMALPKSRSSLTGQFKRSKPFVLQTLPNGSP